MSRLKDLRIERGYTQVKMQMLTGIDQSVCSKIERGERYLSFEQCKRVALALHTSMDYLAGLTDEKAPYPRKRQSEGLPWPVRITLHIGAFTVRSLYGDDHRKTQKPPPGR